jgi:ArsR family transcriptional regulator
VTQPTLSHHMKILEKAKLITVEKKGQWHHYSIKEESVAELFLSMEKVFNDAKK